MMSCEVCNIQKQNDPRLVLYENDDWITVLRPDDQLYLGKSVISLKEHEASLSDLSDGQWLSFADSLQWLESHVARSFMPTHFNWQCLMNLGAASSKTHVHWHCVPRYDRPVEFAGQRFIDELWPRAVDMMGQKRQVDNSMLRSIAEQIRNG